MKEAMIRKFTRAVRQRLLARTSLLLLGLALASTSRGETAPLELSVVFDKQPVSKGITFDQNGMRPGTAMLGSEPMQVWTVGGGSAPGMPWGRSVMFTFTDPRFKNGKMPAVDLEIVYKNNSNAPVTIKADTARGPVEIGGDFGVSDGLKTLKLHLDDAYFGARQTKSDPMAANPDGCDIRLTGFNSDMQIKSIRVLGGPSGAPNRPEASIVFDKEPKETGLSFNRSGLHPNVVNVPTQPVDVWVAQGGSATGMPWGRSVRFTVTDPRFREGKMPAVDIEVVYKNHANAPVLVKADTARGPVEIGSSFGESNGLQTMKIRLDDAYFGARQTKSDPMAANPDGCDIRITGFNRDLDIRSIRVRGYDLEMNPDFARLLKIASIETQPDDIFLFTQNQKPVLNFGLQNSARRALDGRYSFTLKDGAEKVLSEKKGEAQFAGAGQTVVPFAFDASELRYGVYHVEFKLWEKSSPEPKPLIETRTSVGIASGAKIGKAKPGEFLYGIDARLGGAYHNPMLLRWMDALGVDILRHGFDAEDNVQEVADKLPIYDKAGVQVMLITGAPWNENATERQKTIEHRARFLEQVAGRFKQIHYFELGNEPDLKFFYGGPMDDYVAGYTQLYDAVKRGNPDSVVTNGGLCFFGAEGEQRARRFVELVNPQKIDAFAYHGHGPGAESERAALTRIKKVTAEFGKTGKPFIETESGLAAKTPAQLQEQARTVIQKMVFAQSEHAPLFMWFRLLMFEEDYGSLNAEREPRPAALAYRTMVETLRGYSFSQLVNVGPEGTEGYLFSQNGGPGRVCVMWANQPALYTAYLAAGSSAARVKDTRLIDMFGNVQPADLLDDGTLRAPLTQDPVFVKWETTEPEFVLKKGLPIIDVPPGAQLVFNAENSLSIEVRNPFDKPIDATLTSKANAAIPARVEPAEQKVSLAAREKKRVNLSVRLEAPKQTVTWPEDWTVFVNVDDKGVDLAKLTAIPETLPGVDGKAIRGERSFTRNNLIDFAKLGGAVKEKAAAVIFAEVDSDADRNVTIGAGADWWMAWFVNGQPVYDTLANGNQGAASANSRTFAIPLRKGRNLLAVKVLSGSGGWKLAVAGPDALAQVRATQGTMDHIALTLAADGKTLASEKLALQYTLPIPALKEIAWNDPIAKWERRKPTAVFDESSLHNLFDKFPDATRWWHGLNDFSGRAWLACDEQRVYFIVKVTDDVFQPGVTPDRDSLQLGLSRDGGDDFNEYLVGQKDGKVTIAKTHSNYGMSAGGLAAENHEITAAVERVEHPGEGAAFTVCRISIDRQIIGKTSFFTNLLVNDSDFEARKQYLEWRPGFAETKEPKLWYRATLEK